MPSYHIEELRGRRVVAVRSRPTRQAAEALAGLALLKQEALNARREAGSRLRRGFRVVACDRVDCPHCERREG
jgi:hypothetical protein